jgi:hypothetical protein
MRCKDFNDDFIVSKVDRCNSFKELKEVSCRFRHQDLVPNKFNINNAYNIPFLEIHALLVSCLLLLNWKLLWSPGFLR